MRVFGLFAASAAMCWSTLAGAVDFAVRVEPGAAFPLGNPQSDSMHVGGGGAAKAGLGVADGYVDVQAGAAGYGFSGNAAQPNQSGPGAFALGGGARVQKPHRLGGFSPWADVDMLYVRTGPLDRPGVAAATGVHFALDRQRAAWLGPFVRYMQVMSQEKRGIDDTDAKIVVLGVGGELGGGADLDRDKDGVLNESDRCPDVYGEASNQGCPIVDADGDGVPDATDKCPKVPGPADNDGCPYPDRDADGVLDRDDACPTDKGPASNRGCPLLDTDGDGFVDKEDRCPTVPGKVHGCPDPDGDGLVPPEDQCPEVAGQTDNRGCPTYKQIVVTDKKIELNQKIFFAFGKTVILTKSFGLLDEVAQALKDNPSLRVQIEGHTDSVGDKKKNYELSLGRANAVVDYLTGKAIDKARLSARGFGPDVPLDTNATADGRERNRRVEFVIVDENNNPVGSANSVTKTAPSSTRSN